MISALAIIGGTTTATLVVLLAFVVYKIVAAYADISHLRDLLDDATKRESALIDERDALKVDNDRLKPALATSDSLLAAANARITELLDAAATLTKASIDAAPLADLVAQSHGGVLPHGATADPTAPGDHHDPAAAVPDPTGTGSR